jgi:hypothetical protein
MSRKPLPRAERRELARQAVKDAKDRERLARLAPGGTPERPIEVVSASLVDVQARSMRCPLCSGTLRLDEHAAERGLRVARVTCTMCLAPRAIWFRIVPALPS